MKTIFDLPEKPTDIVTANQGMANLHYDEIQPLRNVTDIAGNPRFSNGVITMRWHYNNGQWYLPNRSYIKMVIQITRGANDRDNAADAPNDGNPLNKDFKLAAAMGLPHSIIQQVQYKIKDKVVEQITNNYAQVAAYKTRYERQKTWLGSIGQNTNFWNPEFRARMQEITDDGDGADELKTNFLDLRTAAGGAPLDTEEFRILVNAENVVEYRLAADANVGAQDLRDLVNLRIGDYFLYNTATNPNVRAKIIDITASTIVLDRNLVVQAAQDILGTAWIAAKPPSRRLRTFELYFQPCLSLYQLPHALPGGSKHELDILAFPDTVYQKNGVESLGVDLTHNNNFRFLVKDIRLYNATCQGPLVDRMERILDLEETRCQILEITTTAPNQIAIDVSPSTNRLGFAFQDNRVGQNTIYSNTKFKIGQQQLELGLTKFYMRYGGLQLPNPDYDPQYNENNLDLAGGALKNTDQISELWIRNLMYNGAYYDSSAETLEDWKQRGIYTSWPIVKTATDRESRAYVKIGFENLTDAQKLEVVNNGKLLVFDTYRKVAILKMINGDLQEILVNDV